MALSDRLLKIDHGGSSGQTTVSGVLFPIEGRRGDRLCQTQTRLKLPRLH